MDIGINKLRQVLSFLEIFKPSFLYQDGFLLLFAKPNSVKQGGDGGVCRASLSFDIHV